MDELDEGEPAIADIGDEGITEHAFICPYCWEQVTMLVDTSITDQDHVQEYVEDCEVCCNPIAIHVATSDGRVSHFDAQRLP